MSQLFFYGNLQSEIPRRNGSPETSVQKLWTLHADIPGLNAVVGTFGTGDMPIEQTTAAIRPFAGEVMPAMKEDPVIAG